MILRIFFLFSALFAFSTTLAALRELEISTGKLVGTTLESYGNQTGYAFLNIPFGQPPVGELRFRKPLPAKPWTGILNATEYGNACMANPDRTFKTNEGGKVGPMSEDCLQLNVFTNEYCIQKKSCAVMAIYHGGGMLFESPVIFEKEPFINNYVGQDRNIVVVNVGYRLGIYGFMNFVEDGKGSFDKNLGLYDSILGLQWIQKEISHFGGDPKKVTLFGHSAGGTVTEFLTLSPLTEGLYRAHVAMSPQLPDNSHTLNVQATKKIAITVGCGKTDKDFSSSRRVKKVVECLRQKSAQEILDAQIALDNGLEAFYGPCTGDEVLPQSIFKLLPTRRKLPMLIGTVTGEMRGSRILADKQGVAIPERLSEMCEHVAYEFLYDIPPAAKAACQVYYSRPNVTQFLTDDLQFYMTTLRSARELSSPSNNVFVYSYSYNGAGPAYKKYQVDGDYGAPKHSEELIYAVGMHRGVFLPRDYEIERIFSGLFANFINNLDPSPSAEQKWLPWNAGRNTYFHIDFDKNLAMPGTKDGYYHEPDVLWNRVIPETAGERKSLKIFPPHYDLYHPMKLEDALKWHWNDDKTVSLDQQNAFQLWRDFLAELKTAYRKKDVKKYIQFNDAIVNDPTKNATEKEIVYDFDHTASGWSFVEILMLAGGAILLAFAIYYSVIRISRCRAKSNNYERIPS